MQHLCLAAATWLLGGLLGAALVRMAPGFEVDGREMDGRYSGESLEAMRAERAGEQRVAEYYARHLAGLFRGDFGVSRMYGVPVRELLGDRLAVTVRAAGWGLAAGWVLALAMALPAVSRRGGMVEAGTSMLASGLVSAPTALLAVVFFQMEWPVWAGLAVVVCPRVFRYARNVLVARAERACVLGARAAGVREGRILLKYVLWPAAPELLSLAGVSASLAFSAAIPMEALCDVPGVGALAWEAALNRDFPLLVNVTMLVALIVLGANLASEMATAALGRERG